MAQEGDAALAVSQLADISSKRRITFVRSGLDINDLAHENTCITCFRVLPTRASYDQPDHCS
jgi:hypothetical protein